MFCKYYLIFCFQVAVLVSCAKEELFGDNEGKSHQHVHGSHSFREHLSEITGESVEDRLVNLVKQIDVDGSNTVILDELTSWVSKSYQQEDEEESLSKLPDYDTNHDGHVSWAELLQAVYGYNEDDVNEWATDTNKDVQEIYRMVKADEEKFRAADKNKDGQHNVEEFSAYLHPYDYEYMHDIELNRVIQEYDVNKDGLISLAEYSQHTSGQSIKSEDAIVDRENFATYDRNSDGKLDRHEIHQWAIPDHADIAQEEAYRLFQSSDDNGDRQLSLEEIIAHQDLWLGNAATGYGQHVGQGHHHDESEL